MIVESFRDALELGLEKPDQVVVRLRLPSRSVRFVPMRCSR
jgi:hypothetical protein